MDNEKSILREKIASIQKSLQTTIGVIVCGKDCIGIFFKSKAPLSEEYETGDGRTLYVWGAGGSTPASGSFEIILSQAINAFATELFSRRDLNLRFIQDLISSYMAGRFYDRKSEMPVPMEFALAEKRPDQLQFAIIDYHGEMKPFGVDDKYIIFGCTNKKIQEKVAKRLETFQNLDLKKLTEAVEELFDELGFEGAFFKGGFCGKMG